jgi:hypothetical protein
VVTIGVLVTNVASSLGVSLTTSVTDFSTNSGLLTTGSVPYLAINPST